MIFFNTKDTKDITKGTIEKIIKTFVIYFVSFVVNYVSFAVKQYPYFPSAGQCSIR